MKRAAKRRTSKIQSVDSTGHSMRGSAHSARSGISNKRHTRKTKTDRLIDLLSKPSGARGSVVENRLGWQPHTVRAALSGLRKRGFEIERSRSPKSGETIYAIVAEPAEVQK
jgi:hypothetical protein